MKVLTSGTVRISKVDFATNMLVHIKIYLEVAVYRIVNLIEPPYEIYHRIYQ